MSRPPIQVAIAQSRVSPDVRENGREVRELMRRARFEGATLVQFPEGAMSGCSKAQVKDWGEVAWEVLTEELRATAGLARELGLWVVVGCAHRITPPSRPHNSLYVISDRGELVHAIRQEVPLAHRDHGLAHPRAGAPRLRGARLAIRLRPVHRNSVP